MLIDLFYAASREEKAALSDDAIQKCKDLGLNGLVLVGEAELPSAPAQEGTGGLSVFTAATLTAGEAKFWALPPTSDTSLPDDLGDDPSAVASTLADAGWAVLLCNPYARELAGGELRDRAVGIHDIHGYLSFTVTAPLEENLLAQELAMAQRKTAAAGTGATADHSEFGRYFSLVISKVDEQGELVEAIRNGQILPVESASGEFAPIEAPSRPRGEGRRDNSDRRGGRDRNRGRGRDKRRGNRDNNARSAGASEE